jgi:hypothetical protein
MKRRTSEAGFIAALVAECHYLSTAIKLLEDALGGAR